MLSHGRLPADAMLHWLRADLYRAFVRLLRRAPSRAELLTLESVLWAYDRAGRFEGARAALAEALLRAELEAVRAEHQGLFAERGPIDVGCERSFASAVEQAFLAAGNRRPRDRMGELEVLAVLAARTADAIEHERLEEAAYLAELQARFLSAHAGVCLETLAAQLERSGQPFYARVGKSLGELVEQDVLMLEGEGDAAAEELYQPSR